MALPEFNANHLLPDGIHYADQKELAECCVDPFPSSTRRSVYAGFCAYQAALAGLGLNITQWVDGSFVDASRADPEDVDLANFSHAAELNALDAKGQTNAELLMNGREATKGKYHCHTFLVVSFPVGHPMHDQSEKMRAYWREWFAKARDYRVPTKPEAPWRGRKGLVEMTVGSRTLSPAPSHAY